MKSSVQLGCGVETCWPRSHKFNRSEQNYFSTIKDLVFLTRWTSNVVE